LKDQLGYKGFVMYPGIIRSKKKDDWSEESHFDHIQISGA
jgi:hypothetical protein